LSTTVRALAAAFAVALASLGGSLYLAHERQSNPDAMSADSGLGLAAVDLRTLLENPNSDQGMLDSAFRQVENTYYKPIDASILLAGERKELLEYLHQHKISNPELPSRLATGDEGADLGALNDALADAEKRYGKSTSDVELTQAAIRGMLDSLGDPYTTYLSPNQINSLEESLKGGDFGGIGVYIVQDPKTKQVIVEPIDGTPAAKAGVKLGDHIISVDGHVVSTLELDDIERLIRGKVGTTVVLLVKSMPSGATRSVPITRQQIYVPSVHAEVTKDGYDYVRLAEFGQTSYDEVRKALLEGKAQHVKGYILDLRDNGGGLLDAAVQISSLFIPSGTIVSTIDRVGRPATKSALHDSIGATPLVILVNKYTASASEITAGAVQDYKAGTLIGTKTFGKGVVQSIYPTSDGGALKITTAKYVTPLGRDIQHKGIEPDVVVDQDVSVPIDTPADLQLAAAKSYLRRIARR
jgi:carboxyl-terminal processing protease